ncbi:DUF4442 domain-containing protein [uncultured Lutibacter sp.]|uniref:DUF4442 domain-containing protein n=1 Tax=uncultured Lutibacter sp. TaxID=437739 RepID=UPI00263A3BA7|nr:DUF4442 domain-containing protein [uncultured Lutibacter sp.]
MEVTVKNMNRYLMFKLPSAYICGVKLKELDKAKAVVCVKYKWINQNPFNSMYFAVQSMAAELTTGAIVIKKIKESGKNISMLVTNHKGAFSKKAVGLITFTCNDGSLIDEALKRTIETGEGQTITMKSVGVNEKGEQVSAYEFEWSVRLKSNK